MNKYIYLIVPSEGLAGILTILFYVIELCKATNRTLIFDGSKTCYKLDFSEYININFDRIIFKQSEIDKFLNNSEKLSVYPENIKITTAQFKWSGKHQCVIGSSNNFKNYHQFHHSESYYHEKLKHYDVLVHAANRGGLRAYDFIKEYVTFKECLKEYFINKYKIIQKPYISIQIRNTDRKCNYIKLYQENESDIQKIKNVYLATDEKISIDFFKDKNLNIYNFTEFASNQGKVGLHKSNISGDMKIKSAFLDLYLISKSERFISNSIGGYVILARKLFDDKYF